MAINPTYNDRVRYMLMHEHYGASIIDEPIGWDTDEKEIARDKQFDGIISKFSNNLKFIGSGAEFIELIYEVYGINETIYLKKEERHPHTNRWEVSYNGTLDLSTYEKEKNEVSVKFNSSGLDQILKARESEKVEIDRIDTLDGEHISPIEWDEVLFKGKRIFLKSEWTEDLVDNKQHIRNSRTSGRERGRAWSFPIKNTIKSHEQARSTLIGSQETYYSGHDITYGVPDFVFFTYFDLTRNVNLKIDMSFKVGNITFRELSSWKFSIKIMHYENGINFDVKDTYVLFQPTTSTGFANSTINLNFDRNIELLPGESLGFIIDTHVDAKPLHEGVLELDMTDIKGSVILEEDSSFQSTTSKFILAHDLGERLTEIITGRKDAFYSEALGRIDLGYEKDGVNTGALNGFTHGFFVRGFDKEPQDEENKFKPLTTSFKDFVKNMTVTWNLGLGIEKFGLSERIRIENKKYFYNNNVLIRLGKKVNGNFEYIKVGNLKRTVATEHYISSLIFGYEKGWDNEEAMGLDEYNAQTKFNTCITRLKNDYEQVSPYVGSVYAKEFARRKNKERFPTTDHAYDTDIFALDLKKSVTGIYEERVWQDDFEKQPTGIFSPETATNLRLTPFHIMQRHGWVFSAGLHKHYDNLYTKYTSSEANSKLSTKLIGDKEYREDDDILNEDLELNRFLPEWVEFDYKVDFEIMQQVEGTTEILGVNVPNFYGLVEFMNENGNLEKGFLFSLKPNGAGKWKILKSSR